MRNYFRNEFNSIDSVALGAGSIIGGWDPHIKQYVISINNANPNASPPYSTIGFSELNNGFTSFFSYNPSTILTLKNKFYTFYNGALWRHYSTAVNKANFYGVQNNSNVKLILNPNVSASKSFLTINYEGTPGWKISSLYTDSDIAAPISEYTLATTPFGLQTQLFTNNFKRKENKFFSNILNVTPNISAGEIYFGQSMSGIKGFFATLTISTDNISNTFPELYAVSSNYIESSY
jgi:hypothetical protein